MGWIKVLEDVGNVVLEDVGNVAADVGEAALPYAARLAYTAVAATPFGAVAAIALTAADFGVTYWIDRERGDSNSQAMLDAGGSAFAMWMPVGAVKTYLTYAAVGLASTPKSALVTSGSTPAPPPAAAPTFLVNMHTGGCPEDSDANTNDPTGMYPVWAPPTLATVSGKSNNGVSKLVYDRFLQLPQLFCSSWKQLGDPGKASAPPLLTTTGEIESAMNSLWTQVVAEQSQASGLSNYADLVNALSSDFTTLAGDYNEVQKLLGTSSSGSTASGSTASGSSLSTTYSPELASYLLAAKTSINTALAQMQSGLEQAPMATITPPNGTTYEDVYALSLLETAVSALNDAFSTLNDNLHQLQSNIQAVISSTPQNPAAPTSATLSGSNLPAVTTSGVIPTSANTPLPTVQQVPGVSTVSGSTADTGSTTAGTSGDAQQLQNEANQAAQQAQQQQDALQQQEQQAQQQAQEMEMMQMAEQMMQQLGTSATQAQNLRGLQEPQAVAPAQLAPVPQATATPPPVEATPAPLGPTGPTGPVAGPPDTGTSGATGHPGGPAQRTPGADGSVVYTFPDGRTQKVSPIVAQALDSAFSNAAGTDARAAYSSTSVTWQQQRNPGTRVDPNKLMTGDVCKWENRTALVVAFGPDTGGSLEVVVDGHMQQFAADMHDSHGDFGQFDGFFHPAGIEATATSAPDAGALSTPGVGGALDSGSATPGPTIQVTPGP